MPSQSSFNTTPHLLRGIEEVSIIKWSRRGCLGKRRLRLGPILVCGAQIWAQAAAPFITLRPESTPCPYHGLLPQITAPARLMTEAPPTRWNLLFRLFPSSAIWISGTVIWDSVLCVDAARGRMLSFYSVWWTIYGFRNGNDWPKWSRYNPRRYFCSKIELSYISVAYIHSHLLSATNREC